MSEKKEKFFTEVLEHGSAVLVGPLLNEEESKLISPSAPILFVDGGLDVGTTFGLTANRSSFTVGDGDSASLEMDSPLPSKKDFSDLGFALSLIPKNIKKIELWGFLGGRKDHELINFGEVHGHLYKKTTPTQAQFSQEVIFLSAGNWSLEHQGIFSLMALAHPRTTLTRALEYPVESLTEVQPLISKFLSNSAQGKFELSCDGPVFLYGSGIKVKGE